MNKKKFWVFVIILFFLSFALTNIFIFKDGRHYESGGRLVVGFPFWYYSEASFISLGEEKTFEFWVLFADIVLFFIFSYIIVFIYDRIKMKK